MCRCVPPAVSGDLIRGAKEKHLKVKGPVRLPTKVPPASCCICFLLGICCTQSGSGNSELMHACALIADISPPNLLRCHLWVPATDPRNSLPPGAAHHHPQVALR